MGLPLSPYRTVWLTMFAVMGGIVVLAIIGMVAGIVFGDKEPDYAVYEPDDPLAQPDSSGAKWLEVRRRDYEFSARFPGAFTESESAGEIKLNCETPWARFSLLAQRPESDELARSRDLLKNYALGAAKDAGMTEVRTAIAQTVYGCLACRLTGFRADHARMSALVVVASGHRFVLVAADHREYQPIVEEFFGSFRPLKPDTTEVRQTRPGIAEPIYIYFVGTNYCSPGREFHGVLVARGADFYKWEILENELPQGLEAWASDDRMVVQGTPVEGAKAGHLKIAAASGDRRTEYLLELNVSR